MMFGAEPIEVFASSIDGARSNMPEIDEMTSAVLRFDGDRLATFTTSFNANGVSDFRVIGTEGNVHADPAYEYAEALGYTLTVGENERKKKGRRRDQFAAVLASPSACCTSGGMYFSSCLASTSLAWNTPLASSAPFATTPCPSANRSGRMPVYSTGTSAL